MTPNDPTGFLLLLPCVVVGSVHLLSRRPRASSVGRACSNRKQRGNSNSPQRARASSIMNSSQMDGNALPRRVPLCEPETFVRGSSLGVGSAQRSGKGKLTDSKHRQLNPRASTAGSVQFQHGNERLREAHRRIVQRVGGSLSPSAEPGGRALPPLCLPGHLSGSATARAVGGIVPTQQNSERWLRRTSTSMAMEFTQQGRCAANVVAGPRRLSALESVKR